MKHTFPLLLCLWLSVGATAQWRPRPDAFPPEPEAIDSKSILMASTVEEMASWDRYPTYETYLAMMSRWAEEFPTLCRVDTIGESVQGRLILSMYIEGEELGEKPGFFYSSTIHGDEVTGYVMMLRLIDTLLHGYGSNPQYTSLINRTRISINPLANPDGTYWRGNQTIRGAQRYNANGVDLNRNYPDPFAPAKAGIPQENQAMIDYFQRRHFRLSANLHGGAEVMNYPWDSFTSEENPHPYADWWTAVGRRFVDTTRVYDNSHFRDVPEADDGVVAGGDWYVIDGGRQDYVNAALNCLEITMELSTTKMLPVERLNEYWGFLQHSLVNYIEEIHSLPEGMGIATAHGQEMKVYPNPTTGRVTVRGEKGEYSFDLSPLKAGVYLIPVEGKTAKVIKL